ncbi:hypothetical protein JRT4AKPX_JRT4AKP_02540 [Klebsiella pneumoniae]|nr:hypothetical protein JRT4AKPX_JRT4AKP_02540 [Klebsiella pneumoniae]
MPLVPDMGKRYLTVGLRLDMCRHQFLLHKVNASLKQRVDACIRQAHKQFILQRATGSPCDMFSTRGLEGLDRRRGGRLIRIHQNQHTVAKSTQC